jgi:hypothetical protein
VTKLFKIRFLRTIGDFERLKYIPHLYEERFTFKSFQFCDLKTNLHIRVHASLCHRVSNLFPPIFIEILAMSYFLDVIEVKESELFQFRVLKTNFHIRVHAFPCRKVSNLLPIIFIEILAMTYFLVVGGGDK